MFSDKPIQQRHDMSFPKSEAAAEIHKFRSNLCFRQPTLSDGFGNPQISWFINVYHHVSDVNYGYIQHVRRLQQRNSSRQRLFAQGAYRSCQLPVDRGLGMGRRFSRPLWSLGPKLGRSLWLGFPGSQEGPWSTPAMLTGLLLRVWNECRDWPGYIPGCENRVRKKNYEWLSITSDRNLQYMS